MEEWNNTLFKDLYLEPSKNGVMKPKAVRGSGYKMVNMGELYHYDRISNQKMDYVPLSESEKKGFLLESGDLLFARQSLVASGVGKCSIVTDAPEPTTFESHLIRVRLNKQIAEPQFYYYFFQSTNGKKRIQSYVNQVAAAGIRGSELAQIEVPLPPLHEQNKIARILGNIDDKIELNRRMNITLEAMTMTLYRHYFIDFGLSPNTKYEADECPFGNFIDTDEMGPVPDGWRVEPISKAIDVNPSRKLNKGTNAPYLEMKNMATNSPHILDFYYRTFTSGTKFINGDTLLARITPCFEHGKSAFVDFLEDNSIGWGSTEYIVLRPKTPIPLHYAYFLCKTPEMRSHALKSMIGSSGRQRVQESCFDHFFIAIPPEKILNEFNDKTYKYMKMIKENENEIKELSQIRDYLLPKLLSGEVRVQ